MYDFFIVFNIILGMIVCFSVHKVPSVLHFADFISFFFLFTFLFGYFYFPFILLIILIFACFVVITVMADENQNDVTEY